MIRSLLYLNPRSGDTASIADFYRRHRVLERALRQDGCLGAELQVPLARDGSVLVTALWRDADSYQGWIDNPDRAASSEELAELIDGDFGPEARGELYEIVVEASPPAGNR